MQYRTILTIFLIFGFSLWGHAQLDVAERGLSIRAADSNYLADVGLSLKLSPIEGLTRKVVTPRINYTPMGDSFKKKSGVNMVQQSTLQKPTWDVRQQFTEDRQDISEFSKDYMLGNITTSSKTVVIKCRDHEYVDGDRIRLSINDVVIHPNLTLYGDFYTIDIDLKEGYNEIHFLALNEGLSRPNTAQLKVLDENGAVIASNRWLITTGYKASLIVYRE
ncbi:MAG: hypothetical protein KJO49_13725 [Bacteroidia bacterium]|nr:hypothetical protein [Bacteroidia bacterium]MBT8269586.1 hypothetical protein [Bacteroidia bacterium]NNF82300.1 hypothetical protein [Flavobacteriaceae bacterium]NNK70513.1 hypothetical protein [Flavobacteriaceae bacterium]NNL80945.1 hypothetical protein [Flavobacteriaceae bacterium]